MRNKVDREYDDKRFGKKSVNLEGVFFFDNLVKLYRGSRLALYHLL